MQDPAYLPGELPVRRQAAPPQVVHKLQAEADNISAVITTVVLKDIQALAELHKGCRRMACT